MSLVCVRYDYPEIYDDFKDLLFRARLTDKEACRLFGITIQTLRLWKRKNSAPLCARRLTVCLIGDLGWFHKDWRGFRFADNHLWTDTDIAYTVGDIRAISYLNALVEELQPRKQNNNVVTLPIDDLFSRKRY